MLFMLLIAWTSAASLRGGMDGPSGSYTGTATVLGQSFVGKIVIESESTADLYLSGEVSITCEDEPFHMDGKNLVLDDIDEKGDCLHDTLHKYKVKLVSSKYDPKEDQVTLEVKYAVIDIKIVCSKEEEALSVMMTS